MLCVLDQSLVITRFCYKQVLSFRRFVIRMKRNSNITLFLSKKSDTSVIEDDDSVKDADYEYSEVKSGSNNDESIPSTAASSSKTKTYKN